MYPALEPSPGNSRIADFTSHGRSEAHAGGAGSPSSASSRHPAAPAAGPVARMSSTTPISGDVADRGLTVNPASPGASPRRSGSPGGKTLLVSQGSLLYAGTRKQPWQKRARFT